MFKKAKIQHQIQYWVLFFFSLCLFVANSLLYCSELTNSESFSVAVNAETDITVEKYPADGNVILIWQPHERGLQAIDQQLAKQLSQDKIEVL